MPEAFLARSALATAVGMLLVALAGCGGEGKTSGPANYRIDERAGSLAGVRLGDPPKVLEAIFGERAAAERNEPLEPLAGNHDGAPQVHCDRLRDRSLVRYEEAVFLFSERRLCEWLVVADDAQTTKGVSIGDPLKAAQTAYPKLRCGTALRNSEYPEYPYCTGRLEERRYIWFGGDPINTIEMNTRPLG